MMSTTGTLECGGGEALPRFQYRYFVWPDTNARVTTFGEIDGPVDVYAYLAPGIKDSFRADLPVCVDEKNLWLRFTKTKTC